MRAGSLLAAAAILISASSVRADQARMSVLMLSDFRSDSRASVDREQIIRTTLSAALGKRVDYYAEFIDALSFQGPEYGRALSEFFARKYANRRFDAVIAVGGTSLEFARANRMAIFSGAPIIASTVNRVDIEKAAGGPPVTGVVRVLDPKSTLEFILRVQPGAARVFVVAGGSAARNMVDLLQQQLRGSKPPVAIEYALDLPMEQLLARASTLPPHSAILYLAVAEDGSGHRFLPTDALALIHETANAPIYGLFANYLDYGLTGGNVIDTDIMAREVAELTVEQLHRGAAEAVPIRDSRSTVPMINWRELRRWGIRESLLPAGTVMRYRELTLWERDRPYILGAVSVLALQTLLIAGLLVQRARRMRAEAIVRGKEADLRDSYERIRQLAGRLITAQETTRTRIARDLHDDVCQELAGISITVGQLKQRQGDLQDASTQGSLTTLQERTVALADGVRRLSHDLHPSILQHVGLVGALRAHCRELEARHAVRVVLEPRGDVQRADANVALCLYRIAQEALRNAIAHGEARRLTVSVAAGDGELVLAISDDGTGFDLEKGRGAGLGLVSMEERIHLVGGRLQIDTRPGHGTTIRVRVAAHPTVEPAPQALPASSAAPDPARLAG